MKIDGACHCGAITFEAEVDPEMVLLCHCSDCQSLSGSPYRASVAAPAATFRILTGEPSRYVKTGESGNKRIQTFCGACGSPIFAGALDSPEAPMMIRLGTVRQRDALVPKHQIWTRSEQIWVHSLDAIPGTEAQ